jgi:hypothetical protein
MTSVTASWTFSSRFWKRATERAIKSAAQFMLLAWVGGTTVAPEMVNAWIVQWDVLAGIGIGGALFSYMTSISSAELGGTSDDPSLV